MTDNNVYGKTTFNKEVVTIEKKEEKEEDYSKYLTECVKESDLPLLTDCLGVDSFKADYLVHENIKRFNIGSFYGGTSEYTLVLSFRNNTRDEYNIIDLNNNLRNIKGTKKGNGAFIKSKLDKVSTLIITDSLIHAVNASIAFEKADILSTTSSIDTLKFNDIEFKKYRSIILSIDRQNTDYTHFLNANYLPKPALKKIRTINYSMSEYHHLKNLSDIVSSIATTHNTKRLRLREGIKMLKNLCKDNNFILTYMKEQVEKALERFRELKIEPLGMDITKVELLNIIEKILLNCGNANSVIEHYINLYTNIPMDSSCKHDILLNSGEFLTTYNNHVQKILGFFSPYRKHVFLSAPTGTGKTHLLYNNLFLNSVKRVLAIVAYRDVVNEIGANGYSDIRVSDTKDRIMRLLKNDRVVMTTDTFVFLLSNHKEVFLRYIKKLGMIAFDEQHLYYDSLGFRDTTVVRCYDYLINQSEINVLFMSGTPILPTDNSMIALITVRRKEEDKHIVNAYINTLESISEVKESLEKQLEKGAVLFYCSSVAKSEEVFNLFVNKRYDTILINRHGYYINKISNEYRYSDIETVSNRAKTTTVLYVATTKATTGVNFQNLKTIYQYGTSYTPNTLVQLIARMRNGGDFFMITPKHESNRLEYRSHTAKALTTKLLDSKVSTLSDAILKDDFKKWFKEYVSSSVDILKPKEFISRFNNAFKLMHSIGIGVLSPDRSEFTMNINTTYKDIKTAFDADDINQRRKYIERLAIDSLVARDIEALNRVYNLSFIIKRNKLDDEFLIEKAKLRLITEEEAEAKKAKRSEELEAKELKIKEINRKLDEIGLSVKDLGKNDFTEDEILKLRDFKSFEKVNFIEDKEGKIMALKFHITPRKTILKEIYDSMQGNSWITVREVSKSFRSKFVSKRQSNPFSKLIIELLTSEFFIHRPFKYKRTHIDKESGKMIRSVIVLSKDIQIEHDSLSEEKRREYIYSKIDATKYNFS